MNVVAEVVLDDQGCPYVKWHETGKDFYDHHPVGTKFCVLQPQQEPVAMPFDDAWASLSWAEWRMRPPKELFAELHRLTSPQPAQRTWVGLTDEEISLEAHNIDPGDWNDLRFRDSWHEGFKEGARAIEAKLKEKNT